MKNKSTMDEINEKYDLELNKIINNIKKCKAKLVLLQFPDGLKQYATIIVDYLEEKTDNKIEFLIWLDTCYGACDIPILGKEVEKQIDLIVQFGHNELMPRKQ